MFQSTMSPKMLNVDKLEKKFASLTRSRESIQGLSMWIIRHKDCYKEIVNQWLDALTRDFNALTMFYVANDVIQNCGRKKAPEFREAFASVLEKAVSLEKVKEIKTEVIRMLTLWHDRSIYGDEFFKKLEDKLNATVAESESEKEEDMSEADVIANFKLENVINSLKKLKTLEEELHEKETFLEDIEEPGMCNIDNLIVKMDSQKELRKFDKFQKLVEDCISLTDKVLAAKKVALLNLKYSSIFYNAQMEDAKKVAHAYRIYGKKVKILEKTLTEKISTLPEQTSSSPEINDPSPCADLNSCQESISIPIVTSENDKSDCQENHLEVSISPQKTESESKGSTLDKNCKSISEETSPSTDCAAVIDTEKSIDDEEKIQKTCSSSENVVKDSLSEVTESSTAPKIAEHSDSKKTSNTEFQPLPDVECIDFLLEKAYDDQVKYNKLSFKRKIDNLLKLKQAKACKLSNDEDNINNKMPLDSKISSESSVSSQSVPSDSQMPPTSSTVSNQDNPVENKGEISKSPVLKEESNFNTKSTNDSEEISTSPSSIAVDYKSMSAAESNNQVPDVITDVQGTSNAENISSNRQTENFKDDHPVEVAQVSNSNELKNASSPNSFSFQTLPDIPTELLKNILDKHRINMNLSANTDTCSLNISNLNSTCKYTDQPDSSENNDIKDAEENHGLVTEISEKVLKPTNSGDKSGSQELLPGEDKPSANVKDPVSFAPSLSNTDNVKSNHGINSTIFLENLQSVLGNFTRKETSFKELKCSKTLSALTSMPLENSLRVFSCIMQSYNKVDCVNSESFSASSFNSNAVSNLSSKELMNNETFCSTETKTSHNSQGISPVIKEISSVSFDKEKEGCTENFSINSKNDNLEIMDMEVDSEDENSQ